MILETERLIMRPITLEDLPWLVEMRTPPAVNKFLGGTRMQNGEALAKRMPFYLECHEKYGFGMSVMTLKDTGEQIGTSGLQPLEDTGDIEVGYNLSEAHWRKGIGYECARRWLEHGFENAGLERIVAVAHPENTGSWRIMEKCGMTFQRNEVHYDIECVLYAITKEEFLRQ